MPKNARRYPKKAVDDPAGLSDNTRTSPGRSPSAAEHMDVAEKLPCVCPQRDGFALRTSAIHGGRGSGRRAGCEYSLFIQSFKI